MLRFITWRRAAIAGALLAPLVALEAGPRFFASRRMDHLLEWHGLTEEEKAAYFSPLPTRKELVNSLEQKEFDILVIGGGATGCGVALDAVTRGLEVALVEKFDFASGTSSRSTKLIHGGIRYLYKAIWNLDREQFHSVSVAMQERGNLMEIAPHLAEAIPIMLPIYSWWRLPYYWVGIKIYDLLAGPRILRASYFLNKSRALENFPMLKKRALKGALVYYDGIQEDARMNLSIAMTAARLGAVTCNYCEAVELLHETPEPGTSTSSGEGRLSGVVVRDTTTGREIRVRAKCVINASGPYTDALRRMDNRAAKPICAPSSGVHIVLPGYYSPVNMGLLDPVTKDDRVIFFLPWQGSTMAGTTDNPCLVSDNPTPQEEDIEFILDAIRDYLTQDVKVKRGDVLSVWSGIRPLVVDPRKPDTQSIARNHILDVSPSGLITIAGGRWTTYRIMAQDAVDIAVKTFGLKPLRPCMTEKFRIEGAHMYTSSLGLRLSQDFGLDPVVAKHLAHTYGDRAKEVAQLASLTGKRYPVLGVRLHPDYPYLEAEVRYACREYACRAVDVLARRTRLAFLNVEAALEVLPRVVEIMAKELHWDAKKQEAEIKHAKDFLVKEMGLELKSKSIKVPINFTSQEVDNIVNLFHDIDKNSKGFITLSDLRKFVKHSGANTLTDEQLRDILNEVDLKNNGQIRLLEFLQFMSALKTGAVSHSRFQHVVRRASPISVERSGGGL